KPARSNRSNRTNRTRAFPRRIPSACRAGKPRRRSEPTLDCPANRTGRETMNYRLAGVVAIGLLLAPVSFAAARTKPAPYAAALADPARPATDRERDAARLPGEL